MTFFTSGRIVRRTLWILTCLAVSEAFLGPPHPTATLQQNQQQQQQQQQHTNTMMVPPSSSLGLSHPHYVKPLYSSGRSSTGDKATYIDPDFRLAGIFLTAGLLLDLLPILQFTLGPIITLLGVLFFVQTIRLKFVCDSNAFELMNTSQESGENIVVGGANRWAYTSFVNYEFFPKGWIDQPQGPILVYFKETQTPSVEWSKGPGKSANSPDALANGAKPGQVHFFPALCNCKQLRAEWEQRGCKKL
jgi:Protein of unknown function (DUF3119)